MRMCVFSQTRRWKRAKRTLLTLCVRACVCVNGGAALTHTSSAVALYMCMTFVERHFCMCKIG